MLSDDPSSARDAEIEHQAADWLTRRDRGFTAAEQDQFFQWLAADPQHGEWLARHQQTWIALKSLSQWRPEHGTRPNPDLMEAPSAADTQSTRHRYSTARWAIAASLLLLFSIFWWMRLKSPTDSNASVAEALPPIEERQLEDGSVIALNRGAVVAVEFTSTERRVRLTQGEAHFTVAKNPLRPFIVTAGTVQLRAVGTAFNVNLQARAVEILVTEGKVAVTKSPGDVSLEGKLEASKANAAAVLPPILEAGQRAIVSLALASPIPAPSAVSPNEIAHLLAWQPRRLEFSDTPLAQVVAEFNRDNQIKMVVDDPELGLLPIGATLKSDNVEGFVRLLEASFHVKAEHRRNGVIVLRRATTP